jgi:excisionase family DNA binding protein
LLKKGKTMSDQILTTAEIAAELRCSKAQVYRLLNGNVRDVPRLPSISLGRKKVIRRSAFEDWKEENEKGILAGEPETNAVGRTN